MGELITLFDRGRRSLGDRQVTGPLFSSRLVSCMLVFIHCWAGSWVCLRLCKGVFVDVFESSTHLTELMTIYLSKRRNRPKSHTVYREYVLHKAEFLKESLISLSHFRVYFFRCVAWCSVGLHETNCITVTNDQSSSQQPTTHTRPSHPDFYPMHSLFPANFRCDTEYKFSRISPFVGQTDTKVFVLENGSAGFQNRKTVGIGMLFLRFSQPIIPAASDSTSPFPFL